MKCMNCGQEDTHQSQFCMKCGQPFQASAPVGEAPKGTAVPNGPYLVKRAPRRKRALAIVISISIVLLAVIVLMLVLDANPAAGRWYSQSGTELILLQNGKGMTVTESETARFHFMYAIGYKEPGYVEGEIYDKAGGVSTWFYMLDGKLELNGEYFYRQKPSGTQ